VAALVIDRAKADGSDAPWSGTVPTEPGKWRGVNPADPTAGSWKTWVLTSGAQLRPAAPPSYDSAQEAAELAELKNFPRNFDTNFAAFFWQSAGAFKLYGDMLNQKLFEYHLDSNPPRAARAHALMSVANYDATVACWDGKYTYWAIRPFQLDPTLITLFPTPNHPSYPAAHACNDGAIAPVLGYLFPRDADFFAGRALEAANSRFWAGIHFRSDLTAGAALGSGVAQLVIDRGKADRSQ
jgi:hypothetical protein